MRPSLSSRRRRARPSVVLPEPDSPTMPTVWPSRTATLTPSTALTLPARELMRIGVEPALGVGQADEAQELKRAGMRRGGAHMLVQEQRLGDLLLQRVQRVERGHRLLEDHRDAAAAHALQQRRLGADQLAAVEADRAF